MSHAHVHRRQMLQGVAAAAALSPVAAAFGADAPAALKGRIKHSACFWCFNVAGDKWDAETMCKNAVALGLKSVELINPEHWGTLKKHGLACAISSNGMPGAPFMRGFNNPVYQDEVITRTKKTIDQCAEAGVPSVIAFVGYKWKNADDPNSGEITRDECERNCVKGLKDIAGYAEQKGVTICVEHLNTRDDSHPMKGHPGYQGDDLDLVAGILRKVGSDRVKLLFDIYHVQIMHGDIIRRIEQTKDVIGHIHTAGNPGRAELDDNQEIAYGPIMKKLVAIGYKGYVGHEFIPTRDPLKGLREAVTVCDV